MVDQHSDETSFHALHEAKCKTMTSSTELLEYLMDSVNFLKTEDVEGWKQTFQPTPQVPLKPRRLRQSPNTAPVIPMSACKGCGSEKVIDDVPQGQWVCIECGLIQQLGVCTADIAHCSYDRIQNTAHVHIHRYSRIVHSQNVIRLGEGNSSPEIDMKTMYRLQVALDGKYPTKENVILALKKLGLRRRYRRHAQALAVMCGAEAPKTFPADLVINMCKMFRRVEYFFDKFRRRVCPERKVFLSYKFVLYQLLHHYQRVDLTDKGQLLKGKELLREQRRIYAALITHIPVLKLYQ